MERAAFKEFVSAAVEDVLKLAENRLGQRLPRPPRFQWVGHDPLEPNDIAEEIANRVYLGPELIRPCVDIGVAALDSAGRPLIVAIISGHPPRAFGANWTGRRGPFVYFVGGPLLNDIRLDAVPRGLGFAYSIVSPEGNHDDTAQSNSAAAGDGGPQPPASSARRA